MIRLHASCLWQAAVWAEYQHVMNQNGYCFLPACGVQYPFFVITYTHYPDHAARFGQYPFVSMYPLHVAYE